MSRVLHAIAHHARTRPAALALLGSGMAVTYGELARGIDAAADHLRRSDVRVLALALDNGPAWALWDLAAQRATVAVVPIPPFFTPEQTTHALTDAGVEALVCAGDDSSLPIAGCQWRTFHRSARPLPAGTAKVTYTSGTTRAPKGVCLAQDAVDVVVASVAEAAAAGTADRHLALLPLAVLLENIGGLYVPLYVGGTAMLEPLARVGMAGSSTLDAQRMLAALGACEATTAIAVPGILDSLVRALEQEAGAPDHLRYLAVGGAVVSPRLLTRARALGLPAYQGYGLSECASVVAVNGPGDDDPASVGRPLRHTRLAFADDGEILVRSEGFLGYLGEAPRTDPWWATGDLGRLDAERRLHIHGRKKNVFITAFGRNVSPEWIEAELSADGAVQQAVVFGEARPWNVAVIVSSGCDTAVDAAVARANTRLPDYAQVRRWLRAAQPFTPDNGLATANGRPRRDAVWNRYADALTGLYDDQQTPEATA